MNPLANKKVFLACLLLLLAAQIALAQNASNQTAGANATVGASANASANATLDANATASNETIVIPEPELTPLERELGYYVEESESSEIENFTHEGSVYELVKVGGRPQMILDSTPEAVTDEAKIRQLAVSYALTLPLPFKRSDFNSVKFEFGNVNASWDKCKWVFKDFETGSRTCIEQVTRKLQCWVIYTGDFGPVFNISGATTANRYNLQNGTIMINEAMNATVAQLAEMDAQFENLNLDSLKIQLYALQNNTQAIRAGYTRWNPAFAAVLGYPPFATDGGLNRCSFDATALTNLEKAAAVTGIFPNPDAVATEVIAGTTARYDKGQVKKLSKSIEKKFSELQKRYDSFKEAFKQINSLEPTAANALFEELSAAFSAAKVASNRTTATSKVGEFDSKHARMLELLASSEASLAVYQKSLGLITNATQSLNDAFKVYGQNDPRLIEMQKTVSELKSNFELKEADLRAGRPVTAADFQALASNATNFTASVQNLPRRENEIDPVLIGGLVLLVALIGGGIFFLKKYKQKQQAGQ